jgi:hypothetical protein
VGYVEGLARIGGCRVSSLSMKYLGFPLGTSYKVTSIWNGIIKKKNGTLVEWMEKAFFFLLFYDKEPLQDRVISCTHPYQINLGPM